MNVFTCELPVRAIPWPRHPIMKYPGGRCTIDNTTFELPLQEGENELLIALANDFFCWGIVARLDRLDELSLK